MKNRSEKDRISAFLFIVVFLLVVTIVVLILKSINNHKEEPSQPEYQPQGDQITEQNTNAIVETDPNGPTVTYTPVDALPSAPSTAPAPAPTQAPAQPKPTQAPAPTQTPATPAPTQAPTPAPVFTPTNLGSGSFESDTGTGLNIRAEWSARTVSESQVEVTVTVYCLHQTLHTGAYNPVNFMVDDQYATAEAKKIDSDSYDLQRTEIASRTFTVNLAQGSSKTFWVNVVWEYGGSYSGVALDSIECGENITLNR